MCNKHRGRVKDNKTKSELKRRQDIRRAIEDKMIDKSLAIK